MVVEKFNKKTSKNCAVDYCQNFHKMISDHNKNICTYI